MLRRDNSKCQPINVKGECLHFYPFYGPLEKPDPSYRYEKNLEIRKGDLLGRVSVSYDWSDEDNSERVRGSASVDIVGMWKYQPKESYGHVEYYRPEPLKVIYSYWERVEGVTPQRCPPPKPDCTELLKWELKDSGTLSLPVMYDMPHPMGRFIIYNNIPMVGSFYEVGSPGTLEKKTIIHGREHLDGCDECRVYVPHTREIIVGYFLVRASMGPHGEMKGSESWTNCSDGYGWDNIGFGFNQLPNLLGQNKDPLGPKKEGDCGEHRTTRIRAQWNFKKIKK